MNTEFRDLEILGDHESGVFGTVTFVAHLFKEGKDVSFTEKSYFEKVKDTWFYRSGQLSQGHTPNLITIGQLRLLPLAYYGHPILRRVADPIVLVTEDVASLWKR